MNQSVSWSLTNALCQLDLFGCKQQKLTCYSTKKWNLSEGYHTAHRNYETLGQPGPKRIRSTSQFQVIGNKD